MPPAVQLTVPIMRVLLLSFMAPLFRKELDIILDRETKEQLLCPDYQILCHQLNVLAIHCMICSFHLRTGIFSQGHLIISHNLLPTNQYNHINSLVTVQSSDKISHNNIIPIDW
jgi:hypothetical protein